MGACWSCQGERCSRWDAGELRTSPRAARALVSTPVDGAEDASANVCFANDGAAALTLCWVDDAGALHHFYALTPARGADAIVDGSVRPEHHEIAGVGDAFLVFFAAAAADAADAADAGRLINNNNNLPLTNSYVQKNFLRP